MDTERKPKGWGKRHTFALLSFLGFANIFAMRVNLSVTIVKMVGGHNTTNVVTHQNSSFQDGTVCNLPTNSNNANDIISHKVGPLRFLK